MLDLILLSSVFIAISHVSCDVIFRDSMSYPASQWTLQGSISGFINTYCLKDDSGNLDCLQLQNGAIMTTTNGISTVGFTNIKFRYFLSQHNKADYKLDNGDTITFYCSIDNTPTWQSFIQYTGPNSIAANGKADYTTDDVITVDLPSECAQNAHGTKIQIKNEGINGKQDRVFVDEVSIIGDKREIVTTTAEPTKPTSSPTTKAPTTKAPTTKTPTNNPTTKAPTSDINSCPRLRKPYHLLTSEQKQFFADGINALNQQGRFEIFAAAHNEMFGSQAHGTSLFLPWHRWYLKEIETQIRKIPGYECWTLAYWDVGYENEEGTAQDPWWLCSQDAQFGGYGDQGNHGCLGVPYDKLRYQGECVERNPDFNNNLANYDQFFDLMENPTYGAPDGKGCNCNDYSNWEAPCGFRVSMEYGQGFHPSMHCFIGGNLCQGYSPSDPTFFLIHAFVDFAWAFWQTCQGKDTDGGGNYGYCGDVEAVLHYGMLENTAYTTYDKNNPPKVKDVLNLQQYGVQYEIGDFGDSDQINAHCNGRTLNPNWMVDSGLRSPDDAERRRLGKKGGGKNRGGNKKGNKGGKRRKPGGRQVSKKRRQAIFNRIMRDSDGKIRDNRAKRKALMVATCFDDQDRLGHKCDLPVSYYNCNDLKDGPNGDIEISLQELIDRIQGSQCMIRTRKKFYAWAKITQSLRGLCDGQYDNFCDKDLLKQRMLTKTAANSIIFSRHTDTESDIIDRDMYYKYFMLGSIVLTLSVFITICIVCINNKYQNKQYAKVQTNLMTEKELPSDGDEEDLL